MAIQRLEIDCRGIFGQLKRSEFCLTSHSMGTNGAPLLADIFLYSYEAAFIQSLLSAGKKRLASQFNFTYRYIDDVLSINNREFENYLRCIPLSGICHIGVRGRK